MAKSKKAIRRRKARKAKRARNIAAKAKVAIFSKSRNQIVLGMILRNGAGSHGDEKKRRDKTVCRKKVEEE